MTTQQKNEPKNNKCSRLKGFVFSTYLASIVLLLVTSIIIREGLIHKDDLGNTLSTVINTHFIFLILLGPLLLYEGLSRFQETFIHKVSFIHKKKMYFLLTVAITVWALSALPMWVSMKFNNETKVFSITSYSLIQSDETIMVPYNKVSFEPDRYYASYASQRGKVYQIKMKYLDENSQQAEMELYSTSHFRFFGKRKHRDDRLKLFRSVTAQSRHGIWQ